MSDIKRIVFIVNHISGTISKRFIVNRLERELDPNRFAYDIVDTKFPGHATEIARQAANQGVDIVCAIGGDGTVNETARALVHTETALGIIPSGSGNGLARHLHIPMDAIRAIRTLLQCEVQTIDYGLINLKPFFCTCGVGFDAFISQKFAESGKRGMLSYLENVLRNARSYNAETYNLDVVDEQSQHMTYKAVIIACANASQYGNNVYIAPEASVHDGLVDVTIIEPFDIFEATEIAFALINGTLNKTPRIKTFRCKHLHITREKKGVAHYDGDPFMTSEQIDVTMVKGGLRCICPTQEGVQNPVSNVQNAVVEYFNTIFLRSEDIIANNLLRIPRPAQVTNSVLEKLSRNATNMEENQDTNLNEYQEEN
jgi:YegS/Rv2252/BmrU family lipid kinase